jgi:mannose-6-phosphate isomerase-like protein (cupin superfamily)
VVNIDDVQGAEGRNGTVRFVRREVGVEAFGINWFELGPGAQGLEHDEAASRQEEVYLVLGGSGHWLVDDGEIAVREGSFLRVDPETKRCPVAGQDGMTFVSVGVRRGSYEPHGRF